MKFYLGKSVVRILLLALFVACVGLFISTGQASAHSYWQGGDCGDHGHDNGCNDGYGYGYGYDYGYNYNVNVAQNCDSWDPKTGFCLHWRLNIPGAQNQSGGTCDTWDSHTGNCTHWTNNSNNNSYNNAGYYDPNYHDANYYYKYYCDRYHCNCG